MIINTEFKIKKTINILKNNECINATKSEYHFHCTDRSPMPV